MICASLYLIIRKKKSGRKLTDRWSLANLFKLTCFISHISGSFLIKIIIFFFAVKTIIIVLYKSSVFLSLSLSLQTHTHITPTNTHSSCELSHCSAYLFRRSGLIEEVVQSAVSLMNIHFLLILKLDHIDICCLLLRLNQSTCHPLVWHILIFWRTSAVLSIEPYKQSSQKGCLGSQKCRTIKKNLSPFKEAFSYLK